MIQRYEDTMPWRYDDTTIRWYDTTTIRRYEDATIRWYDITTIRRYDDTTLLLYHDTRMRRYDDTTLRRYDDTRMRRYDDTTIRLYDNITVQRYDNAMMRQKKLRRSWLMFWPFAWVLVLLLMVLVNASLLCNYAFKQVRRKGWTARWLSQRKWAIIFGQTDTTCSSWSAIMWVKLDHHALQGML